MAKVSCTVEVSAPPQAVFDQVADIPHAAEFITGIDSIEMLTSGPVGTGTRWREARTMFGRTATEEMEITDFQPPKSYSVKAESHGALYESVIRVEPSGAGSRLTMDFEATPVSFMAKLMRFMMKGMMASVEKHLRQDLADIKTAVETRTSQASPARTAPAPQAEPSPAPTGPERQPKPQGTAPSSPVDGPGPGDVT